MNDAASRCDSEHGGRIAGYESAARDTRRKADAAWQAYCQATKERAARFADYQRLELEAYQAGIALRAARGSAYAQRQVEEGEPGSQGVG